jgi:hypothetical protein
VVSAAGKLPTIGGNRPGNYLRRSRMEAVGTVQSAPPLPNKRWAPSGAHFCLEETGFGCCVADCDMSGFPDTVSQLLFAGLTRTSIHSINLVPRCVTRLGSNPAPAAKRRMGPIVGPIFGWKWRRFEPAREQVQLSIVQGDLPHACADTRVALPRRFE